jgi:hypothetical protein
MESTPSEDPGPRNRPSGALALVTAAVCHIFTLRRCRADI